MQNQIKMLQAPLIELDRILRKRKNTLTHLQALATLHTQGLQQLELVNTIATILPTSAYLSTMENNMPFVILSGQAKNQTNIKTILRQLKRLPWLKNPELKITVNPQQRIYKYNFTLQLHQD